MRCLSQAQRNTTSGTKEICKSSVFSDHLIHLHVWSRPFHFSSAVLQLLNLLLLSWLMTTETVRLCFFLPQNQTFLIAFHRHVKRPLNGLWKIPSVFLFYHLQRGKQKNPFCLNQYLLLMLSSPKIIDSWSFVQPPKKVKRNLKVTTLE